VRMVVTKAAAPATAASLLVFLLMVCSFGGVGHR